MLKIKSVQKSQSCYFNNYPQQRNKSRKELHLRLRKHEIESATLLRKLSLWLTVVNPVNPLTNVGA